MLRFTYSNNVTTTQNTSQLIDHLIKELTTGPVTEDKVSDVLLQLMSMTSYMAYRPDLMPADDTIVNKLNDLIKTLQIKAEVLADDYKQRFLALDEKKGCIKEEMDKINLRQSVNFKAEHINTIQRLTTELTTGAVTEDKLLKAQLEIMGITSYLAYSPSEETAYNNINDVTTQLNDFLKILKRKAELAVEDYKLKFSAVNNPKSCIYEEMGKIAQSIAPSKNKLTV